MLNYDKINIFYFLKQTIFMKRFIKNFMLFISVFVPLYILIELNLAFEIINGNLHFNILNTTLLIALFVLIIIGISGAMITLKTKNKKPIRIKIITQTNITDQHFFGYFSLFVLFALSYDLSKISMTIVFFTILTFIGIVYIQNDLYYINPFLNLIGYSFYKVTYIEENNSTPKETNIFYRGKIELNQYYKVYQKKNNLSFLSKK